MGKHTFKCLLISLICLISVFILVGCNNQQQQAATDQNPPVDNGAKTPVSNVEKKAPDNPPSEVKKDQGSPQEQQINKPAKPQTPDKAKNQQGDFITLEGSGISKPIQLTLTELQRMQEAIVADKFFSLNNYGTKEYFSFKGVSLWYLLNKAGVKNTAQTVTITAEDGYSVTYTLAEIKRDDYIDEQNPEKKYKTIIAWEENGKVYDSPYPFRFVVGQKAPGDINKPNWVQKVKSIKVD